jgi:hypothetical protein
MTNSRRDEHGNPGFQINDFSVQFQFPFSFEDIINFVGPFVVMSYAVEDVCYVDIDFWSVSVGNDTDALTTNAMDDLRSILQVSDKIFCHEVFLSSQFEDSGKNQNQPGPEGDDNEVSNQD